VTTATLVGFPHMVGARSGPPFSGSFGGREVSLLILYGVAILALVCLCGLLYGDPGVLRRSEDACFPLPTSVRERLAAGRSLNGLQNVRARGGRLFCVRCCVWRPADTESVHHCSICNRCIRLHDHHCGVR
jgi:hypothetical protein